MLSVGATRVEQLSPWSPSFTQAQLWSSLGAGNAGWGQVGCKPHCTQRKDAAVSSQKAQQLEPLIPQSEQHQAKDSPWLVMPLHRVDFSCTELLG